MNIIGIHLCINVVPFPYEHESITSNRLLKTLLQKVVYQNPKFMHMYYSYVKVMFKHNR